jgi:hypothetical protein
MENYEHIILKICGSTTDKIGSTLLYENIVRLAREKGKMKKDAWLPLSQ